jgi:hypothetical protein
MQALHHFLHRNMYSTEDYIQGNRVAVDSFNPKARLTSYPNAETDQIFVYVYASAMLVSHQQHLC